MEDKIQEVTRQEQEELFKWLFGNDIKLKRELDIALSPYYEDDHIYYIEEIYHLFQTEPMKREGKIMQLGSLIFLKPNSYHTRLEHSKGAYRRCVEFLAIQYRKPKWRKYIEDNKLKGYLVEKMKFMCVHDIGHSMFSHSIENWISKGKFTHEDIGQRIVQENEEIKNALSEIKANEIESDLEGDGSLELFCEGNIDFDRMDYLFRDMLYFGEEYEGDLILKLDTMCDLKWIPEKGIYRYVYQPEALPYIEKFLQLRDNMYKTDCRSSQGMLSDQLASYVVQAMKDQKIKNDKIHEYLNHITGKEIEQLDINTYLKTNDILFFSQLIEAKEELEKDEILCCAMPSNQALVQLAISLLNPQNTKYSDYNEEERDFIKNLKQLLREKTNNSPLAIEEVIPSVKLEEDKREEILENIRQILGTSQTEKGIYTYEKTFEKYNPNEPIYIENQEGTIFTLDQYPDLQMDLSDDEHYGVYVILPELKEQGISLEKINQVKKMIQEYQPVKDDKVEHKRMNMFQTQHMPINYSEKLNRFFKEER